MYLFFHKFKVGAPVLITSLDVKGIVKEMTYNGYFLTYTVRYTIGTELLVAEFEEKELEEQK